MLNDSGKGREIELEKVDVLQQNQELDYSLAFIDRRGEEQQIKGETLNIKPYRFRFVNLVNLVI